MSTLTAAVSNARSWSTISATQLPMDPVGLARGTKPHGCKQWCDGFGARVAVLGIDGLEDGYDWPKVEVHVPGIFRKSAGCDVDVVDGVAVGDGDGVGCNPEHFCIVLWMVILQHATLYPEVAYSVLETGADSG